MAASMAAIGVPRIAVDGEWVGLSTKTQIGLPTLCSQCPFTAKSRGGTVVSMAVSVDKKYTTQKSEEIFTAAKELMPGGVNSPVRAFKSVGGQPIVFDSVKGSHAWDVDGNEYIDYVGTWGPAIIGHADDKMVFKVLGKMLLWTYLLTGDKKSVSTGAIYSILLLQEFIDKLLVVHLRQGPIHDIIDPFLVKAGSGVATLGLPDSPGVPKAATYETLTAAFNDLKAVEKLFSENKGQLAAVILEPVVGNSGFIAPKREFLQGLRELTQADGALLVFDEVMTGFRIAYGGAQEYFGITPDLTTLGKIIGGGLPVGAYGGRREIMEMVAPAGPVYQAGTLSGNPLAMTAGICTLQRLQQPGSYEYLDKVTGRLIQGLLEAGKNAGHQVCGGHISGMFGFFFTEGPVYNFSDAKKSDTAKFARFFRGMLEQGVYFAPSQFEAGFTSLTHSERDIEHKNEE